MRYSIGEFSKLTGLPIDTLRFYEKQRLVFPQRDSNNRRYYTDNDVVWIEFVIRLKKTGMSISTMQRYAELRYQGDETIPQRLQLLFDQLDELHAKQDEINGHIRFIEYKMRTYMKLGDTGPTHSPTSAKPIAHTIAPVNVDTERKGQ
jgi:DNA-binding transcriptional MerR regulator